MEGLAVMSRLKLRHKGQKAKKMMPPAVRGVWKHNFPLVIIESLRLERPLRSSSPTIHLLPTLPTKSCPQVPHLLNTYRAGTPSPPWAARSGAWTLFWRRSLSKYPTWTSSGTTWGHPLYQNKNKMHLSISVRLSTWRKVMRCWKIPLAATGVEAP